MNSEIWVKVVISDFKFRKCVQADVILSCFIFRIYLKEEQLRCLFSRWLFNMLAISSSVLELRFLVPSAARPLVSELKAVLALLWWSSSVLFCLCRFLDLWGATGWHLVLDPKGVLLLWYSKSSSVWEFSDGGGGGDSVGLGLENLKVWWLLKKLSFILSAFVQFWINIKKWVFFANTQSRYALHVFNNVLGLHPA